MPRLGGTGRELRDWTEIRHVVRLLDLASSIDPDDVVLLNGESGIATPVGTIVQSTIEAWRASARIECSGHARPGDPFSLVCRPGALADLRFRWEIGIADGITTMCNGSRGLDRVAKASHYQLPLTDEDWRISAIGMPPILVITLPSLYKPSGRPRAASTVWLYGKLRTGPTYCPSFKNCISLRELGMRMPGGD